MEHALAHQLSLAHIKTQPMRKHDRFRFFPKIEFPKKSPARHYTIKRKKCKSVFKNIAKITKISPFFRNSDDIWQI